MSDADSKYVNVAILPACPQVSSAVDTKTGPLSVPVGGKTLTIYSQQTAPATQMPKLTILLLHGQSFTSQNWVDIGTLQYLAAWGYHAIAIDLPGYGKSKDESLGSATQGEFIAAVVSLIQAKPVIISPSMSGGFALPYLFQDPSQCMERAIGYIAVAPVMSGQFKHSYPKSQLPTLIVYGSTDERLGFMSRDDLQSLPQSQIAEIPDAGHACYLNQPALFHNLLYSFLSKLAH